MTTAAGAGAGKDGCVHAWDSRSGAYSRRSTVVACMRVSHDMHACIPRAHATVTNLDAWALEWHPLGCVTRRPQTHVSTLNNAGGNEMVHLSRLHRGSATLTAGRCFSKGLQGWCVYTQRPLLQPGLHRRVSGRAAGATLLASAQRCDSHPIHPRPLVIQSHHMFRAHMEPARNHGYHHIPSTI